MPGPCWEAVCQFREADCRNLQAIRNGCSPALLQHGRSSPLYFGPEAPARRRIRRTMLDATTQTEAVPLARSDLLRSTAPALTPDAAVAPTSKRTLPPHAVSVSAPKAQRSAAAPKLPAVAVNPPPAPPPPPGEPAPGAALRLDHALMLEPFRVSRSRFLRFPEIGIDQQATLSRMAEAYRCGGCGHSGPGDMGASNRTVLRASCAACGKWLLLQPVSHDL